MLDADYLSGPSQLELDVIERAIVGFVPAGTFVWDPDDPHLSTVNLEHQGFQKLQHDWIAGGIPVDLFHDASLSVAEDHALERTSDFEDDVLATWDVGRQLRFLRVSLELAADEEELAYFAAGALEEAVIATRSNAEMDQVAHECSISHLLRRACRDFVWTDSAAWGTNIRSKWDRIVGHS